MKKLTAFAALAALVSSVSIADAQGTMQQPRAGGGSSAGAFCLNQQGTLNCRYQTMAACQRDAGAGADCVPNPRSTTGAGSGGAGGSGGSMGGSSGGGSMGGGGTTR